MFTKYLLTLSAVAIASSTAQAFSDNFNGPDAGPSSAGTVIGPNWVNGDTDNTWAINNGAAVLTPTDGTLNANTTSVLYNTSFAQSTVNGDSTTIEAEVTLSSANIWGGIAFNVQNSTDFYQFRFKGNSESYQLIKVSESSTVAGERTVSALVSKNDASTTFAAGTAYHLSVTSTVSGTNNYITFNITPISGGTAYNVTSTVTDSSSAYLGGYGGLTHANDGGAYTYDNFSIVPEPSAFALIGGSLALSFVMIRRRP